MAYLRQVASIYGRIGHCYWVWARPLLLLAVIVFVPLGMLDALSVSFDLQSVDLDSGIKIAALLGAVAALTATSLLGEVFYSGAVAVSLTQPEHERSMNLRQLSRHIDYRRLIAVDLIYVAIVLVGFLFLFVPGVLAFVWLALAGPVIETEKRSVRGAFARSIALIRGRFWIVAMVLIPIEILGDSLGELLTHGVHSLLGQSFLATWAAAAAANIVLTPIFAVAVVLLTLDLIAEKDGTAPTVNRLAAVEAGP